MFLKHYIKTGQKYFRPFIVVVISVYALYLRLVKLAHHKFWVDEEFQLSLMQGSFLDLLKAVPRAEYCSYLSGDYYLIYPFFKIFSYNKWGLAIPHIIVTILGFYLLYLICKRYFKTIWGYLITFSVVCFNGTLINHATEIRTYAVLPTLALATFYFSQQLVDQNINMNIKKKWAIGAFFVLVIWFHAYGIAILSLPLIFSLLTKWKDKSFVIILKHTVKFLSVVFLVAMPLWIYSVFGPHYVWQTSNINTFQYIPNPLENMIGFSKAILGNLVGYKRLYFLLIAAIFPFIIPYKKRFQQMSFLIIAVFIPIGLILLVDIITKYWFLQRQFIWTMPFFAFFLGWSWDSFFEYVSSVEERRFKRIR